MRIVLDTNVLVRAHAHQTGPAREVLRIITSGPHLLIVSPFILEEVDRVLRYPRLQARWPLSNEEIEEYVAQLDQRSLVVAVPGSPGEALSPDPNDDPIIHTARIGRANLLCTLDRHLRRSRKVRAYCATLGIEVMSDVELLAALRRPPK